MKNDSCIFCKIANGEIPSKTLYEDEKFRVILDLGPATKGHALILPKDHFANLYELPEEEAKDVIVLAKKMAGDGEGATALFETKVIHAASKEDARTLAKSVICSSLTKAAIFGHDANWGRILCALGYSGAKFDPENVDLYFESKSGKIHIFGNGVACDYSEEEATKILSDPEVTALVDMHMGEAEATAWGCDLSYDYVKINADYRS